MDELDIFMYCWNYWRNTTLMYCKVIVSIPLLFVSELLKAL